MLKKAPSLTRMVLVLGTMLLLPTILLAQASPVVKVGDLIKTATVWKTGSTYHVTSNLSVSATLTIQEGVVVKFARDTSISTSGNGLIVSKGTAAAPVIFTAAADNEAGAIIKNVGNAERGYWNGVYLEDTNNSSFVHTRFSYGGYETDSSSGLGYGVLYTGAKNVKIENCTFIHNNGYSIKAAYNLTGVAIKSCTFEDVQRPVQINLAMSMDMSNNFISADQNAIFVHSSDIGISQDREKGVQITWEENRVPFVIEESFMAYQDNLLILKEGVVLKFEAEKYLAFHGDNKANNNDSIKVAKGVKFTSLRDDSLGDTNGDQDASSPDKEDWDGLYNDKAGVYVRSPGIVMFDKHQDETDLVTYRFEEK